MKFAQASIRPNWPMAVMVSLLVHAGLALLLCLAPVSTTNTGADAFSQSDGFAEKEVILIPSCAFVPDPDRQPRVDSDAAPSGPVITKPWKTEDFNYLHRLMVATANSGANPANGHSDNIKKNANSTQSPKSDTAFFGINSECEKVMFVVDRSSSMGEFGVFDRVRRELATALQRLPESRRFQIIVFNSTAQLLRPSVRGWMPASAENKRTVASELSRLEAGGHTTHREALPFALSYRPDVIYFLTDADDLTQAHVRHVTLINKGRAIIHVIELNSTNRNQPNMPLQILARQNGGCYRGVDPWRESQNAASQSVSFESFR